MAGMEDQTLALSEQLMSTKCLVVNSYMQAANERTSNENEMPQNNNDFNF